jgi:hypothetical protein
MTKYESMVAFIAAYNHWTKLWIWRDLFKIGIHCEATALLKTTREEIIERTQASLGPELSALYLQAVGKIDAFNVEFQRLSVQSRRDMDNAHEKMLETVFPKDPKGHHTAYDKHSRRTIAFSMEDHQYVSATITRDEKSIFGYFYFQSQDIRATHCRYSIDEDDEVFFTTEEDIC